MRQEEKKKKKPAKKAKMMPAASSSPTTSTPPLHLSVEEEEEIVVDVVDEVMDDGQPAGPPAPQLPLPYPDATAGSSYIHIEPRAESDEEEGAQDEQPPPPPPPPPPPQDPGNDQGQQQKGQDQQGQQQQGQQQQGQQPPQPQPVPLDPNRKFNLEERRSIAAFVQANPLFYNREAPGWGLKEDRERVMSQWATQHSFDCKHQENPSTGSP